MVVSPRGNWEKWSWSRLQLNLCLRGCIGHLDLSYIAEKKTSSRAGFAGKPRNLRGVCDRGCDDANDPSIYKVVFKSRFQCAAGICHSDRANYALGLNVIDVRCALSGDQAAVCLPVTRRAAACALAGGSLLAWIRAVLSNDNFI